jgi:ferredoxin
VAELKVIVDMDRCEAHGQCVLAAPEVFTGFDDDSILQYEPRPPESEREAVEVAISICPAAAIKLGGDPA